MTLPTPSRNTAKIFKKQNDVFMLKDKVFLTQTDTTIGFVSQNASQLDKIKERVSGKHYIIAIDSLTTLKSFARVPNTFKNKVRRSIKTTFIMPNGHSYRLVKDIHHLSLLRRLKWVYTSSANLSNQPYDEAYAKEMADIVIHPLHQPTQASTIYKLGSTHIKRIR